MRAATPHPSESTRSVAAASEAGRVHKLRLRAIHTPGACLQEYPHPDVNNLSKPERRTKPNRKEDPAKPEERHFGEPLRKRGVPRSLLPFSPPSSTRLAGGPQNQRGGPGPRKRLFGPKAPGFCLPPALLSASSSSSSTSSTSSTSFSPIPSWSSSFYQLFPLISPSFRLSSSFPSSSCPCQHLPPSAGVFTGSQAFRGVP